MVQVMEDAKSYGFSELCISDVQMKKLGNDCIEIVAGFLREENLELFEYWSKKENKRVYYVSSK